MKTTNLITFILFLLSFTVKAQISTTNSKVSDCDVVIKTVKVYDCKTKVESGSTLKTETTKKGKN